jgi:hypothetical protein
MLAKDPTIQNFDANRVHVLDGWGEGDEEDLLHGYIYQSTQGQSVFTFCSIKISGLFK